MRRRKVLLVLCLVICTIIVTAGLVFFIDAGKPSIVSAEIPLEISLNQGDGIFLEGELPFKAESANHFYLLGNDGEFVESALETKSFEWDGDRYWFKEGTLEPGRYLVLIGPLKLTPQEGFRVLVYQSKTNIGINRAIILCVGLALICFVLGITKRLLNPAKPAVEG